eukprot:Pgem_evm1s994
MSVIYGIKCITAVTTILFQSSFSALGMNLPRTMEKRDIFSDITKGIEKGIEDVGDAIVDIPVDVAEGIVDVGEDIADTGDSLADAGVPCKPKVINNSGGKMKFYFYDADDALLKDPAKSFYLEDGESKSGKCSKGVFDHKYCEFLFEYDKDGYQKTCDVGGDPIFYVSYELKCEQTYTFTGKCNFS